MRTPTGLLLCSLLLAFFVSPSPAHASEERVMGNTVIEEGKTVEKVSTVWGDVRVEGEVEGNVHSAFGDVEIHGPVRGDVDAGFGDVYIDAPVEGDVDVGHGDVQLGSGAQVGEKISLGNGSFYPHQEAVFGNVETAGMVSDFEDEGSFLGAFSDMLGWAFMTLMFIAAAVLLAVTAPRPLRAATRSLEASPGRSFVLGLGSLPVAIILSVLLVVTVVGGLLLFLLWPAYFALLFFGLLVASYFLGRKVVLGVGRYRAGDAMAAAVGAVVVAAVLLIPVLGVLVLIALTLLGTGASVSALLARWRPGTPHAARTTYASYEDYLRDRPDG
jgi:cytoskeletal protein CcmA (bactofilin family)